MPNSVLTKTPLNIIGTSNVIPTVSFALQDVTCPGNIAIIINVLNRLTCPT